MPGRQRNITRGSRHVSTALGLALAALLLPGCGTGARLYSPERDKQGQAAKEAWSKVDLKAQVDVPRQNLAKTLAEQLAIEDEIWARRRRIQAGAMASTWTVEKFQAEAAGGLKRVLGGTLKANDAELAAKQAEAYFAASEALTLATSNLDSVVDKLVETRMPSPSCDALLDAEKLKDYRDFARQDTAGVAARRYALIEELIGECKDVKTAKSKILEAVPLTSPGELGRALARLQADEAALENDKASAALALASLKAAQADYAAAEKEMAGSPAQSRKQVDDAMAKLKKVIAKIPATDREAAAATPATANYNAFADRLFSQARLESISQFLATYDDVVQGKGAAAGSNRAAIALALFPDLHEKSQEALANAARPNLTPLILRKNIEQTRAETAQRNIDRQETLVGFRRHNVALLNDQLRAYLAAYQEARKVPAKTGQSPRSQSDLKWAAALQPLEEKAGKTLPDSVKAPRISAWLASSRFLEAEGRMRADVGQNQYRIYALENEGVLLNAESSIAQWKGLVDPSVDLLAQWGAAGIDSKDVIQLINSVMLLGIAVGVN